jgi:hypothetical protein
MNSQEIIQAIDVEIARLRHVIALLNGSPTTAKRTPAKSSPATSFAFGTNAAPTTRKRRRLSPAARARIAAAQKKRWAKVRASRKK